MGQKLNAAAMEEAIVKFRIAFEQESVAIDRLDHWCNSLRGLADWMNELSMLKLALIADQHDGPARVAYKALGMSRATWEHRVSAGRALREER